MASTVYPTAEYTTSMAAPRRDAKLYAAMGVLGVLTAGFYFVGAASAMRLTYLAVSVGAGALLYLKSRPGYVSFTCWMWFLSAFVRRLADSKGGYQETSIVLLAPYLVTALSGFDLLTHIRDLAKLRSLPFVLAFAAFFYGLIVGLTRFSPLQMVPAILNWIVPLCFGFFLVESHSEYEEIRRSIQKTFLSATLVMGIYGIYQFFFLPVWDQLWLMNVRTTTFGEAEPMQLRGFSTMNAPVIFALTMMATLLVVAGLKSRLRYIAFTLGFLSLLLSFNRSAWIGLVAGMIFVLARMGMRERGRVIAAILVTAVLSPALVAIPGVKGLLVDKFETMTDPHEDVSYQARVEGYQNALATLSREPFGEGVASPDILHYTMEDDDAIGPHDSLFLELLYSLGWCGTILYLAALAVLIGRGFATKITDHPLENSLKAVMVALVAQCLLNDIVYGEVGIFLWIAGSMQLAAIAHAQETQAEQADTAPVAAGVPFPSY